MVKITVVVQHPGGKNERLKLKVLDEIKVWQLTLLLEWKLNTGVSALIATEEKALVGNARLEPVKDGETYILAALGKPLEGASGIIAATS